MFFRIIATIFLALAVAGIVILIDRFVLKGRMPKWVLPASIAATILGFHIYQEYDWYTRNQAELGSDYVIIQSRAEPSFIRPWSYIKPSVNRFTAVYIGDKVQPIDEVDGGFITPIVTYAYFANPSGVPFVFDCQNGRLAPVAENVEALQWADMAEFDETLYPKVCDAVSVSQ